MIIRKQHESNFTIIDNKAIQDKSLTYQATGMLCFLLSLPNDWNVTIKDMTKKKKNGEKSVRAIMKELETAGYIKRGYVTLETGGNQFALSHVCYVTETPFDFEKTG